MRISCSLGLFHCDRMESHRRSKEKWHNPIWIHSIHTNNYLLLASTYTNNTIIYVIMASMNWSYFITSLSSCKRDIPHILTYETPFELIYICLIDQVERIGFHHIIILLCTTLCKWVIFLSQPSLMLDFSHPILPGIGVMLKTILDKPPLFLSLWSILLMHPY